MDESFDLIVIGAGPGGYVAAIKAARRGMKVAVVERREVGGTCLNRGCVPTKALMHAARLYREMSLSEQLGIFADSLSFNIEKIYARKEEVVNQLRGGVEYLLKANKVTLIQGQAVIKSPRAVEVQFGEETSILEAKNILIATGSAPARPPIDGLNLPGVITSDELLEQTGTAYKRLIIIGGGVIGMEFATIFHSLGCEVTVIEAMDRILPTMDREISQNLSMILKKRGISIYPASTVERIEEGGQGLICHFTQKGKEMSAEAGAVLVSIGRRPNLEGLLDRDFTLERDRGGIVVDEHFQTSAPGVYAIGDVIHGGIQLAHAASAQGCNAVAYMAGEPPEINLSVVPSCIYTDPEISSAGITADQAKEQGVPAITGKFSMAGLGRSVIEHQERGFIKLVFHENSRVLLGAQLMCARATDLVSELTAAIANKLTVEQLASVIRPHPTFTEGVTEAVEDVDGKAVHIVPKR